MAVSQMTTEELEELIADGEEMVLLDIRDPQIFAKRGHIPGAVNAPAEGFSPAAIPAGTPADTPIVIACYKGIMSREAAKFVESFGYTDVRSLNGGMAAWDGPLEL